MTQPFKQLGTKLRGLREKKQETLAEVSGAVEIELDTLVKIEDGINRPSEDVLMLLASHFGLKDIGAKRLFQLAGYDLSKIDSENDYQPQFQQQPAVMVLPIDARIVYSDTVHVMVNNYGVVMNFMQNAGPNGQQIAVSRIGMSKEHARSVMEVLQTTLEQADIEREPKKISAPRSKADEKPKN